MAGVQQYDGTLYREFLLFFDPANEFADIPQPWVQTFGNWVTRTAVFHDECKNTFNIVISREDGHCAFTRGIRLLLHHYMQERGAWARVFYLGGSEFHVQLMNGEFSVVRDNRTWPKNYEFGWSNCRRLEDLYDSGLDDDDWENLAYSDIEICSSHFLKNRKALPTQLVRDAIFPKSPLYCVLRDQNKKRFFCEYQFRGEVCTLTLGWLDFVYENNLSVSSVVRLGMRIGYPSIIHAHVLRPQDKQAFMIEKKKSVNDVNDTPKQGSIMTVPKIRLKKFEMLDGR